MPLLYLTILILIGLIILLTKYTNVLMEDRKNYLFRWDLGWGVLFFAILCQLLFLLSNHFIALAVLMQIFLFIGDMFLISGMFVFLNLRFSKFWILTYVVAIVWLFVAAILQLPFLIMFLPIYILNGILLVITGVLLIKDKVIYAYEKYIIGTNFIIWGIHQILYPFVHSLFPSVHGIPFNEWELTILLVIWLIISNGLLVIHFQNTSNELGERERRFRLLAENAQDLIFRYRLSPSRYFEYISPAVLGITGYTPEEFYQDPELIVKMGHPEFHNHNQNSEPPQNEIRVMKWIHKSGREVWIEQRNTLIHDPKTGKVIAIEGIARDITERKRAEDKFSLQKAFFQQLFESSPEGIAILDDANKIINVNRSFESLFQYSLVEVMDQNIHSLIVPANLHNEATFLDEMIRRGETFQQETVALRKDNTLVNISILSYSILYNDARVGTYVIFSDITARKRAEEQLKFLSLHDQLTGMYNRTFFEQQMQRLLREKYRSLGVVVCDVDGLKLYNDTMGHASGDRLLVSAADIIKRSFGDYDIVARIGGDEFAILLPDCNASEVEKAIQNLRSKIQEFNRENKEIPLSISIGFAVSKDSSKQVMDVFKEADNNMYREKLSHSQSVRSAIVQTLTKALEVRDYISEGHADRLKILVTNMAKNLNLSHREITDLALLAQFHDIGKVGIPDRILFKDGPLTPEEYREMQRHCEIGYRIAQSSQILTPIADWILRHHEWWDGRGYPCQLKGEEIPLPCRILSIADAFDSMTNHRPHRKSITEAEALDELRRCSGTQFDPHLVEIFAQIIEQSDKSTKKAVSASKE